MKVIIMCFVLVNLVTFFVYGVDKWKAKRDLWRIPEKILLGFALFGGSIGAFLGMHVFNHKTQKIKFSIGVPLIFVLQLAAGIYFGFIL